MDVETINRSTTEQLRNIPAITIPKALCRPEFRFIKLIIWDKKAFEPGWTKTTNYTFDSESLKNWIAKGGNYGVSTGIGGLLVVDIDNVERMKELGVLDKLNALPTYTVRTRSGGLHYYFICRDFNKKRIMYDLVLTEKTVVKGKEIETFKHLGEMQWLGQQVVGPNSRFRLLEEPDKVLIQTWREVDQYAAIREVKEAEILAAFEGAVRYSKKGEKGDIEDAEPMEEEKKTRVGKITATKKSHRWGPLKIGWLDKIKIADIAMPDPVTKSDPYGSGEIQGAHPLHGSESGTNFSINVKRNVWHCFRDNSGGGPLELVAVMNGLIECGEAEAGCLRKEGVLQKVVELLITKYGMSPEDVPFEITTGKPGEIKLSRVRRIVETISEYYHIITLARSDKCFMYEGGVYKQVSDRTLKSLFLLAGAGTISLRAECLEMIKSATVVRDEDIDNDPFTICCENGLININPETWEIVLLPHDPNYLNMISLPVAYIPGQKCPKVEAFIDEITDSSMDAVTIQELFGYLIFREHFIHKAFMLVGTGRNGKSTLLAVMRKFIGEENVTSIPIQNLGDRFTPSELFGKLANISGDIPEAALKHAERFKEVTGEDFILMERKFEKPFYMVNVAKQIFTGNGVPQTTDFSIGFFSRFHMLLFNKVFNFEPGATATPKANLVKELTTPEEMSGLLNLALMRLQDIYRNRQFTYPLSLQETTDLYEELSNPLSMIRAFYEEMLVSSTTGWISSKDLTEIFSRWCVKYQYHGLASSVFLNKIKEKYHLKVLRKWVEGHYINGYSGIEFKDNPEEMLKALTPGPNYMLKRDIMEPKENLVDQFFRTNLIHSETGWISSSKLSEVFSSWCKTNNHQELPSNVFLYELKKAFNLENKRKVVDGHYIMGVSGIDFSCKEQQD